MNKNTVLKVIGIVAPLLVAVAGLFYGDVEPTIRAICDAALPGETRPRTIQLRTDGKTELIIQSARPRQTVDAGAAR